MYFCSRTVVTKKHVNWTFFPAGQQDFLTDDIELEEEKDDMALLNAIFDAPSAGKR